LRKILRLVFFRADTVPLNTGFPTFQDKTEVSYSRSKCPRIPSDAGSNPRRTDTLFTQLWKPTDSRKIL